MSRPSGGDSEGPTRSLGPAAAPPSTPSASPPLPCWGPLQLLRLAVPPPDPLPPLPPLPLLHPTGAEVRRQEEEATVAVSLLGPRVPASRWVSAGEVRAGSAWLPGWKLGKTWSHSERVRVVPGCRHVTSRSDALSRHGVTCCHILE